VIGVTTPVGLIWSDGALLEGTIDLLYAATDGSLHVVDYKTDHITEAQLTSRATEYRTQAEAYATSIERVTGETVSAMHLVFAALDRTVTLSKAQL